MADHSNIQGIQGVSSAGKLRAQLAAALQQAEGIEARQEYAEDSLMTRVEQSTFNPLALSRKSQTLKERAVKRPEKEEGTEEDVDKEIKAVTDAEKFATDLYRKNPEMKVRTLLSLLSLFNDNDTEETIIQKLLDTYKDQYLADLALDYLMHITDPESILGASFHKAKALLLKEYQREIAAGKNISTQAQAFSEKGLGTPTGLRDLYRDITGNPRNPLTLFEELNNLFDFEKLKTAISFILHAIGADLKSKGTSIARGELQRLFTEARSMQAILGVYRFFRARMDMIIQLFQKENLHLPERLGFELLSKQFVKLLGERYPSPERLLQLAKILSIGEELAAQVIIYTVYRDALRGVSPRLFRNPSHQQELMLLLIETISEIDDALEEEAEEDPSSAEEEN